ncbi:S41 family peptidase [Aquimarina sp. RZ0]|uniref:S41 family peptidase n=1 Tax=Aquimarina sp. RZ0 TaxID=2607730 RepID=UPI0011F36235|nr:S41 family peptidase [Aquimarina sp. RZ0]KAA1239852.1 S41 family peptidase [Aquimarina sp. RZ0]
MKLKPICFLAILIGIYSCKETQKTELTLNGTWNSIGYGQQIHIDDSKMEIYDVYENGCSFNTQLPKNYLNEYFEVKNLTQDSLTLRLGFTNYDFVRPNSETSYCEQKNSSTNDPLKNFDALWYTFNENYPSFKLRNVDWQESKEKYRPRLNSQSTDLELFNVLEEMTSELNDGHVSLDIPESVEDKIEDEEDEFDHTRESVINAISNKYVDSLKSYNKGIINWGIIKDTIGYIQINDFEDLANYDIDQNASEEDFWDAYWENADNSENYPKDVLNGIKEIMKTIFNDIEDTKSCIIDVRFNGGGFDQAGLEVLSYFTDSKSVVFSKKARYGNDFTKSQNIYLVPNEQTYNGKLFILTSYQTASASETFVLASQSLKNTKTIGSNTEGILSDVLSKKLPNGWEYGLSNEIYLGKEKINYEKNGIPPDYDLDYPKSGIEFYNLLIDELKTNDRAIEKVIELSK